MDSDDPAARVTWPPRGRAPADPPGDWRALYDAGTMLADVGDYTDAIRYCTRALDADPGNLEVLIALGDLYYKTGRGEEAILHLESALNQGPDSPAAAEAADKLGSIMADMRRYDDALRCYKRSLSMEPRNPDSAANAGEVLFAMGRADEAVAYFESALRMRPDDVHMLHGASRPFEEAGRLGDMLPYCDAAARLNPGDSRVSALRCRALYGAGMYEDAIRCADGVLEESPVNAAMLEVKGNALLKLGKGKKAAKLLKKAGHLRKLAPYGRR